MLQPLLIEIGVEELPAVPLLKELPNIESKWAAVLEEYALLSEFEFYYTPRRLVLWHRKFPMKQSDSEEELFGAPVEVAYKEGIATKAAEGFARKCGVSLEEIGRAQKGGKEVLYFKKSVTGRPSASLLGEMVQKWIKSLNFGKSMRWGSLEESFIRPVRWLNVMLGNEALPVTLFDVASRAVTYPHRMHSYDAVEVKDAHAYFETLKAGAVMLFQQERRDLILSQFKALEAEHGITIEIDEALLDEVVAITEHPTALLGSFDEKFLRLPPEVIITSMKEHQRYFPVFKAGKLLNAFIVVSNALTEDFSKVIEGNERVLRPRLADALFFYDNDLRNGLSTNGLEKVVYMKGLGTMREKIEREHRIAMMLFEHYGELLCPDPSDYEATGAMVERAIELAKADLLSEMVYEFTELQGLMGYYYATALGESAEVALAIKEQYLPEGEESPLPSTPLSAIIAMSSKLDALLGQFSIGEIPTGSRDPFGLRRAVNGIIRIVLEHNMDFDIKAMISMLNDGSYRGIEEAKLESFFLERVLQFYAVNPSIVKAVLSSGEREILAIDKKIAAVNTIAQSESFGTLFSTFKRVANITKDVDINRELSVDAAGFDNDYERDLYAAYSAVVETSFENYGDYLDAMFALKPQLDAFFDNVMVNVDDEAVRENRKALIGSIYKRLLVVADIKEISV